MIGFKGNPLYIMHVTIFPVSAAVINYLQFNAAIPLQSTFPAI